MAKTKNRIAKEMYDDKFANLTSGEKARVTRNFNAQEVEAKVVVSPTKVAVVKVGRVGNGPLKDFAVSEDTTIAQILDKAGLEIDFKKESVMATSEGIKVSPSDLIQDGETYILTPEIKSAC